MRLLMSMILLGLSAVNFCFVFDKKHSWGDGISFVAGLFLLFLAIDNFWKWQEDQ